MIIKYKMAQYIDKNALVAEIEKLKLCTMDEHMKFYSESAEAEYNALCKVEKAIDSLQEEPKFKTGDRIKPVDSCLGAPRTILEVCDGWYVTNQGTLDFEFEDNWEDVEEPVSEDLEEASRNYADNEEYGDDVYFAIKVAFKAGAQWKKEHLWKSADVENLPEYDREVIAITDYDFGHYKVVYAHRPNPDGWNGTNIDTGEKEHFEPVIYGKGGWNQPHILYWLDAKLPYEEK